MHRTQKAIAVFLFATIVLLAAAPLQAAGPAKPARDAWMALWQPLAELLRLSRADAKAASGLGNTVGAAGGRVDPNGLTEPAPSGQDGGDVTALGPSETTEEGGAIDPNSLSAQTTEEGGAWDPNG